MRFPTLWLALVLALISTTSRALLPDDLGGGFMSPDKAFQYQLESLPDGALNLHWQIAPGYYLYRKRLDVLVDGTSLAEVKYPPGDMITDEFFGTSEVYYNQVTLTIPPVRSKSVQLTWQGCAEAGLCYPPQQATIDLPDSAIMPPEERTGITTTGTEPTTAAPATSTALAEDLSLADQLASSGLLLNLALFFGLGLLLVFTPCVLPMIPILSAVIVGSDARRGKAFRLSLAFVVSMALTYSLLGVMAALAGANLQAMLQTPWFIAPLALIFLLLALAMFGLYELQLPTFIRDRLQMLNARQNGGNLAGAALMGFFSALLASPCMTAPLAGALIYIADSGDAMLGGLALLALGLGMGAPLIAMATLGSHLLPKPGSWMNVVKAVFGFILLGTAIWFLERILDDALILALWGALAIALGLSIRQLARNSRQQQAGARYTLLSSSGLILTLWGGLMMIGAAAGGNHPLQPLATLAGSNTVSAGATEPYTLEFTDIKSTDDLEQALAQAGQQGQWTLVDFYADWCVACKVIEAEVFGDPAVQEALGPMQRLRADVTDNDVIDQALMRKLQIIGPPTLLIYGPDGREYRAQRTIGEISANDFLQRLNDARSS
ncbi:protein-disulfide reductase DsbD [Marinobacterium marinum]|uniref:Thiol:disulfide interchange protein DsbD n=1 Tax=Marinobacterium marinum TaxID=2756129 RepID=A0A7W2ABD1_9GAMM|nr:protein-disulfide reductase DsbD [Marinobacterium marinum]MBA4501314.1 protein-disulfide reductase DsbD [Marinobacterium marinum]